MLRIRILAFLFIFVNIAICKDFVDFESDRFYEAAKNFLWCKFCQQIQRQNQNQTAAEKSFQLLTNLNEVFGKDASEGFPSVFRPTRPLLSKIGVVFYHRENVLRQLAKGQQKWSSNGEVQEFCLSVICAGFD